MSLLPGWMILLTAFAQDGARVEEIEKARAAKARNLKPNAPSLSEQKFERFMDWVMMRSSLLPGTSIKMGGLYTGSGFGLGPQYFRPDLANGAVVFRASAVASLRKYYTAETYLGFPRLSRNRFMVDLLARRMDAPQLAYYGPGRESRKTGRSNFRREETSFDARLGWRPMRRIWQFGATGGLHLFNVGPGTDRRFISTDAQFPSLNSFQGGLFANQRVPGLQIQTSYWRGGPFAEISFLDSETDPHRGVRYWTAYLYHHDREHRGYTFRRFEANAEHYLPFFNEKRVIAIRGRTDLSYRNPGQLVPFYLQPTVGGSDDLRGFRQFRFSDNNALVVNAEYRWEAFPALDMAIFADGGKVFNRLSEFDLRHLQTAFGVGFRFKTRDTTAFRIDTGFSREGFQIWFKFNDAFYSSRALGR